MIQIIQRLGRSRTDPKPCSWPIASPIEQKLDPDALAAAADFARLNKADSLLVFRNGRLVFEKYWNGKTSFDLQQTFSGTKAIFALLVWRCIVRGCLSGIDRSVRDLIPEMPARLQQLTFRNILAMQSGMENSVEIDALGQTGMTQLQIALEREINAPPFTRYHYNNAAYRLLFTALERASGMDLEALTEAEIFQPLAFGNAHWMRIYATETVGEHFTGYQSVRMTPRDFAKSSQVILDGGFWGEQSFIPAAAALELITAPAPQVNPSFGLFHHLNGGTFYRDIHAPEPPLAGMLVPGAPRDLFLMYGNGGQITAGVPSLKLVIVRTGQDAGSSIYAPNNHFARLLKLVTDAAAHD